MKNKNWRSVGWCTVHNKHLYDSRKAAKGVCRLHQGQHKSPFSCRYHPGMFHIGELSQSIVSGDYSRDEIYTPLQGFDPNAWEVA